VDPQFWWALNCPDKAYGQQMKKTYWLLVNLPTRLGFFRGASRGRSVEASYIRAGRETDWLLVNL
jgi:hypothetical protein